MSSHQPTLIEGETPVVEEPGDVQNQLKSLPDWIQLIRAKNGKGVVAADPRRNWCDYSSDEES